MKILVTGDWHVPYYDKRAFAQMAYAARQFKPDLVILNGDLIDFYPISTHLKDPMRHADLQAELSMLRFLLTQFRKLLSKAKFVYLIGNHEQRLLKHLWTSHSPLYTLESLRLEKLLDLGGLKITLHDQPAYFVSEHFVVTHGDRSRAKSGYTAHAMIERFGMSGVSGHTHRLCEVNRTFPMGRVYTWAEGGCLCKLEAPYAPFPDWQHGFCMVQLDSEGRLVDLKAVRIRSEERFDPEFFKALPAPEALPSLYRV